MATASSVLSEDQFLCSICLDLFTDPVTVPCGHNFCKACLTRHFEGQEKPQCPLCNEKFNKGLKLHVNTTFRDVVESFKQQPASAESQSSVQPGQVPCDICTGNTMRAYKTCLVCLASFCKIHLEPHQKVSALKRHKLTNPMLDLEDKTCKKHHRIFEFFCRNDQTRVCSLCTDHWNHDTVHLSKEYVDQGARMKNKAEVPEIVQRRGRKMRVEPQSKKRGKGKGKPSVDNTMSNRMQLRSRPHEGCFDIPQNIHIPPGSFSHVIHFLGGKRWDVGIVVESAGGQRRPNCRNGTLMLKFEDNRALNSLPVLRQTENVVVFMDFENGRVFFFDPDNETMMHIVTNCTFRQATLLVCSPSPGGVVVLAGRLRKWVQENSQSDSFWCFILLMFFLSFCFFSSLNLNEGTPNTD